MRVLPAVVVALLVVAGAPSQAFATSPVDPAAKPGEPAASVKSKVDWGRINVAALTFQGSVFGGGKGVGAAFMGPVFTLQAGKYGPVVGVAHIGLGALLDDDPGKAGDSLTSRASEAVVFALGARVRPLALVESMRRGKIDLFVGPLATIYGNPHEVLVSVGVEIGVGIRLGRWMCTIQLQAGWANVLTQQFAGHLEADWTAGGQLGFGYNF